MSFDELEHFYASAFICYSFVPFVLLIAIYIIEPFITSPVNSCDFAAYH